MDNFVFLGEIFKTKTKFLVKGLSKQIIYFRRKIF